MLLVASGVIFAQKQPTKAQKESHPNSPEVIWRDSDNVSSLDLKYGIGGADHAPNPDGVYTFIEEDMNGTSPKIKVKDQQGVEWNAKMGAEPKSETAATRLLWAAGYFVNEDYYLSEIKVTGLPALRRGKEFVSGSVVRNVRLKRKIKGEKDVGAWEWFKNPSINTREFDGLRVMMALVNNGDLKTSNNTIYEVDGERRYVVKDRGAAFGKTGSVTSRSKSDVEGYAKSKFIDEIKDDYIDFTMHSRPLFITALNAPNYVARAEMEKVTQHIPIADAKWLGQRLAGLSDEQLKDCFQSAGYAPNEVETYARVVKERIAALNALE